MAVVTARRLREAIGEALRDHMNSDEVEGFCVELGLAPPNPPDDIAFSSKRAYVVRRLTGKPLSELMALALRVDEEHDVPELRVLVAQLGPAGVAGQLKNLIFAADGPKPRIVLSDAINNDLLLVENERHCLVYDRPLAPSGLTWRELTAWWSEREGLASRNEQAVSRSLYRRLLNSIDAERSPGEVLILRTYSQRYVDIGPDIPALLPQVYLHFDPYTHRQLGTRAAVLPRQRMDFLLLLPNRVRVVIELDGIQHYADPSSKQAEPRRYAEMAAEDRQLRLRGYEVYRFGGHELADPVAGAALLREFFTRLADRHPSHTPVDVPTADPKF